MANEILIVADDLSGAADCAVACALRGLETEVVIDTSALPRTAADVVAIDANTRHLTAADAAAETRRIVRAHGRAPWCFKKIDSTLRGHVGAEVAAALDARRSIDHRAVVIMAPAFPAAGRTTVHGRQRVGGVPLEETEHWSRERTIEDADVVRILDRAGLATAAIGLEDVRRAPDRLHEVMADRASTHAALVCDAETDADLHAIADAAARFSQATVWAGSAGLATCLPDAAGLSRTRKPISAPPARGAILFVIGSPSSISRGQVETLLGESGLVLIPVEHTADIARALLTGTDVVVQPTTVTAAAALGPLAAKASGLVLTGGETARAVLTAMRVRYLRLVDEVERGVPRSLAPLAVPLPIVTKAGAFGDRQTLVRSRAALRNS